MAFKPAVDLLLNPIPALRLVRLDVNVVDEGAQVLQAVQVEEKLVHVVSDLLLLSVLKTESLLVELTDANLAEYTIHDVVMPMIGHHVRLPPNADLAAIYTKLLEQ